MATLTLEQVTSAVGGRLERGEGSFSVSRYAIDSRSVTGGELFFALEGPNHDGHRFIGDAFERGAVGAVVSRRNVARTGTQAIVEVEDTTRALQDLASEVCRRSGARVIGITGSCGKTTTKEMIAAVLATRWKVHASRGNLNNTYGLPLTTLETPDDAEVLVLEMGMSTPGEIARLVEIAPPHVGVLLNVSEVHRENFSSIEEIARAKGELLGGMTGEGTVVYNEADPRVRALAASFPGRAVSFAVADDAAGYPDTRILATGIRDDMVAGVRFALRVEGAPAGELSLRTYGTHNVANAVAALAVGHALGVEIGPAAAAVCAFEPVAGRGVVDKLDRGVVLVDETYNSNPAAIRTVLSSLSSTEWTGRRVFACGDMLELGEDASRLHREIGSAAAAAGVDLLLAVGPMAAETAAGARDVGIEAEVFDDSAAAARDGASRLLPGDLVVVKGSRGIRMEAFAGAVRAAFESGEIGGNG